MFTSDGARFIFQRELPVKHKRNLADTLALTVACFLRCVHYYKSIAPWQMLTIHAAANKSFCIIYYAYCCLLPM